MTFRTTLAVVLTLVLAVPALAGSVATPAVPPDLESSAAEPAAVPNVAPGPDLAAAWEAIFADAPAPESADSGSFCCVSCDTGTTCGFLVACCVNRVPPGRKCCQVP
jgi:hypothetical protein